MRIGVFADTHGHLDNLPLAKAKLGAIDHVLHLGDYGADAERIAESFGVPFTAVRGNCDFTGDYPLETVVTLTGARLLLAHGHRFPDLYALALRAEELHCAAALYGHTHIPDLTAQGALLILNPGSLTRPLGGSKPSCALLTIEKGDVSAVLLPL